tara:strand:- start:765176 stop:765700 length:525 start_codon:yes stop_codon:yes gene_type:complete
MRDKSLNNKAARVFKVANVLKQKVGFGGFSSLGVTRAQAHILEHAGNPTLFEEIAAPLLQDMDDILAKVGVGQRVEVEAFCAPILDLKANGQMFGYSAITVICSDVLDIMQSATVLNSDGVDLFRSLYMSVKAMVDNKMSSPDNKAVIYFDMELGRACTRYRKKYGLKSRIFKK